MKNPLPPFHFDYNENQMVMQNIQEFYSELHHYFEEHTNYFEKISQLPKHLNYEDGLNIVRDYYILANFTLIGEYDYYYEHIDLNDMYFILLESYPFSLFFNIELLEKKIGLTGNLIQRVKEILNSFNSEINTQDLVYNPKHEYSYHFPESNQYFKILIQPFGFSLCYISEDLCSSWNVPFIIHEEDRDEIINCM